MLINSRRMKSALATALCVLLASGQATAQLSMPGASREAKLKEIALSIPQGAPVQVKMLDKTRLSGRIGAVDNNGFELQFLDKGNIVSRKVAFEEVAKLTPGAPKKGLQRMIAPVLTVIGLIGTAGAVTAAIRR